jgi:hypothetical protein
MKNTNAPTVKRETEEYWGPVCQLPLKPAATSRPSDDFDVLADGAVVGTHLQNKRGASRLAVDVRWTSDIRKIARPAMPRRARAQWRPCEELAPGIFKRVSIMQLLNLPVLSRLNIGTIGLDCCADATPP